MTYDQNAQTWTSAQLLADVRRKASIPATSTQYADATLLREATDVLWNFSGWALQQAGEGRNLAFLDRPIVSSQLTSTYRAGEYQLPALAIADTVSNVTFVDATGMQQTRLARLDPADESAYDTPTSSGSPHGYSLVGGRIRLYPGPTTGGTLRIAYQRRHPELVVDTTASAGTITSITPGPTSSFLTSNGTFTTVIGDELDVIAANSPYRYIVVAASCTAGSTGTYTVNVPGAQLANQPTTGARVVRSGQSPYVQLPLELRPAVTEKVAANILRTIGDLQGSQASEMAAKEELARVLSMLVPRAQRDKPRAVNPYSHLRSLIGRRWR